LHRPIHRAGGHGQDLDGPVLEAMDNRDEKELDTVLRKAMADLDPDERPVLIRKTAGFSGDEIADR
jgi:DNA-directed RNA polymerase specialized sigma24 family protein